MTVGQNPLCDPSRHAAAASAFGWAERMVLRQLDTLRRLATAALDRMGEAVGRIRLDPADISLGVDAIEEAARVSWKVDWALRLIFALRAKLHADLERLQRGEAPDLGFGPASEAEAPAPCGRETGREIGRERAPGGRAARSDAGRRIADRLPHGFGDDDFSEILKRPTDEVIALICRTLGLPEDWPSLAEDAWEQAGGEAPFSSSPLDGGGGDGAALSVKFPDG